MLSYGSTVARRPIEAPSIVRSSHPGDGVNKEALAQRHKEEVMLVAAGFNPEEGGDLWSRDGVSYGREASLQFAWREWRNH